ncbi:VOC family protein [Pseudoroseicyclus tamaricis]|uniref:VOC family protein n=1 Tax=Pseudoroseicyclus tamaricis TaxID=2705421 RepID=A0A6B2JWH0_9RHOB|nr:VOC family protein [Pseudoroseicyclus tamaricis]NDV00999.1 VOC family protein [Pseudoroseicyclus tamaricis]
MYLDHLVILANDLEAGVAHAEASLGLRPQPGGRHVRFGTHNALLSIGEGLYLEVLAPEPEAQHPGKPRWLGLEGFDGPPRLANWVCATDDLDEALDDAPFAGEPVNLQRGDLRWRIAIPADGRLPMGGAFPTLIQWETQPCGTCLPDRGCRLRSVAIQAPLAREALVAMGGELPDGRVTLTGADAFRISAEIDTPDGPRHLA